MVSVTVHAGNSVSIQGTEHSLNTKAHINVSSTEQNHKHVICGNKWNEIIMDNVIAWQQWHLEANKHHQSTYR